jgi:membrane-associated protein
MDRIRLHEQGLRMDNAPDRAGGDWTRRFAWALLLLLLLLLLLGWFAPALQSAGAGFSTAGSDSPAATRADEQPSFFWQLIRNLFNSRGLMELLGRPEYAIAAFIALNVIVFTETGLLIGFFLPGDSLLVTAGLVCYGTHQVPDGGWSLPLLLLTLCLSAIIGDSVGYSIGFKWGPKLFQREKSWFFNKDHLLKAHQFYEKHGGKTIILARFVPIVRTFAPVVAGVAQMNYSRFLFFNVFGGVGWVVSMVLIGYFLPDLIDPPLKGILGPHFEVRDHIEKVIIIVVLLSISPGIYLWLKAKLTRKATTQPELAQASREVSGDGGAG